MAINEFSLLVAMLVAAFDFELLPAEPPKLDFPRTDLGNLPPKLGMMVKFRFRGFE